MARDKRDAQSILESHQLLAARIYRVMVSFGTREVWTSSLEILDTGSEPNLVKEDFALAVWAPSIRKVKESRLRSASNAPMEIKGVSSITMQVRQLQNKVGFLTIPNLATNIILRRAFIGKFIEKIDPKAGLIISINSSSVAIVDVMRRGNILNIKSHGIEGRQERLAAEQPRKITRATTLAVMRETIAEVKNSAGVIQLVGMPEHLIQKRQALIAQNIVHTASESRSTCN